MTRRHGSKKAARMGGFLTATFVAGTLGGGLLRTEIAIAQPSDQNERQSRAPGILRCTAVNEELNFPTYWVGPSFEGMELTYVDRFCHAAPSKRLAGSNRVNYSYGETGPAGLAIQNYPPFARHKGLYTEDFLGTQSQDTTVRGVPATRFEDGARLEIYHRDVTVVILGKGGDQVDRAAAALIRAPSVLIEVALYGLVFDARCVDERNGCLAHRFEKRSSLGEILIGIVFLLVGPILAILFRPPPAPTSNVVPGSDLHESLSDTPSL